MNERKIPFASPDYPERGAQSAERSTLCAPRSALAEAQAGEEDPRVTQALEEYLAALESGQPLDRARLQARYPDIADELREQLEGLEFLHRTVARLDESTSGRDLSPLISPLEGERPAAADGLADGHPQGLAALASPAPLADYQVIREVGRGGMGIVYEAMQRSLQRRVALKVLPLGATLDPRHLQRFKNESQAAAQLHHASIVPIYAVGCEQGTHYYAMQFIEGRTLGQHIQGLRAATPSECGVRNAECGMEDKCGDGGTGAPRSAIRHPSLGIPHSAFGNPQFQEAAWMGVQAAEALEHAHQMGVVHRDVKPGNLLLDHRGQLWVTDFGLARWSADAALTTTGDILGTLRYMSPEQASARRGLVDHRTDIYSLGATLYELVTLQPLFPGSEYGELLQRVLNEDPVPPRRLCPKIPRDLETILLKALAKRVEDRYATAQDMADDLRRFLEGKPVRARRPALWERAGKWAQRHRPLVLGGAVVLVLTVLGLTAGIIVTSRERAKAEAAFESEAKARLLEADARRHEASARQEAGEAQQKEAEARARADEARARAEQNFHQAQRLLDHMAKVAAVDMGAESDMGKVRQRLLRATLAYYKDLIDQHKDDQSRIELLSGQERVAKILEAMGQGKEAQIAWGKAAQTALTIGDGSPPLALAFKDGKAQIEGQLTAAANAKQASAKVYTLKMVKGHVYRIDMVRGPDQRLNPYVRVQDANGQSLEGGGAGGAADARMTFWCKRDGAYRVIASTEPYANPQKGPPTGGYTLTVTDRGPPRQFVLQDGQARAEGQFTNADQSVWDLYTLKMVKGHTYQIDMERGNEAIDPIFGLISEHEDGLLAGLVAYDQAEGNPNARTVFSCPRDGDYHILATTSRRGTGGYALTVQDRGPPLALELKDGKARLDGQLARKDAHVYTLKMTKGKTYQFDMSRRGDLGLEPCLRLENAKGELPFQHERNARVVFSCPRDGDYRIMASAVGQGAGSYTLNVKEVAAAVLALKDGKTQVDGQLTWADADEQHPPAKVYTLRMVQGKTYHIDLVNDQGLQAAKLAKREQELARRAADLADRNPLEPRVQDALQALRAEQEKLAADITKVQSEPGFHPLLGVEDQSGKLLPAHVRPAARSGGRNAWIRFSCPRDGDYRIIATTNGHGTGGYALTVTEIAKEVLDQLDQARKGKPISVGAGLEFTDTMQNGAPTSYAIKFESGKTYQIDMIRAASAALNPLLHLQDDQGKELATDDDSGGENNARIVYRAETGGTFRIIAASAAGRGQGEYSLIVRQKD